MVFHNETRSRWVAPKPEDKRSVACDELSIEDKKKFDTARFKEIDNLLKLSVTTAADSDHFTKATPENIIPTKMLDKPAFGCSHPVDA